MSLSHARRLRAPALTPRVLIMVLLMVLGAGPPALAAPPRSLVRTETRFADSPGSQEYPDANAIYLEDEIRFEVQADGHTVYTEHDAIKILTAEGVESLSALVRVYRAGAEEIQVLLARTVSPDGTVLDVPAANIRDVALQPDSPLYAGQRAVRLEFPDVRPGSVVEFHLRTRRAPRPGGWFWAASYVQNTEPMLRSTFTVSVPEKIPVLWRAPGVTPGRPRTTTVDGISTLSWEARNMPGLSPEAAMPPMEGFLSRIEVTNLPSWTALGEWFGPRWQASVDQAQGLAVRTAGLTSPSWTTPDKIRAILRWTAERYSVESNLAETWDPRPARQIQDARALSPTDTAVLVAAVLRRLGLEARPVLASPLRRQDLERNLVQPDMVARLILRVPNPRGGAWWIDPASPGELLEHPPGGLQGGSGILVEPGASTVVSLPDSDADENLRDVHMEARVEADGQAELAMSLTSDGIAAALWRSLDRELAGTPAAQREVMLNRLFQSLTQGFLANGRLYAHYFPEGVDPARPFQVSTTVLFPRLATPAEEGQGLSMPLPLYGGDRLAALADPESRRFPARFDFPFRDEVRLHVALPEGSRILAVPPDASVRTPAGTYFCVTRQEGNQVWFYSRLVVNRAWVAPEDFAPLQRLAQAQTRTLTSPLVFLPPATDTAEETR